MRDRGGKAAVILLAEDDPGDQELTRRAFEEGPIKNDLHITNDGQETLDYLCRRGKYQDPETSPRPDLILLDLNMPKLNGRQVMEQLQADPELQRIPVVVLTTSSQEEDILRSYEVGCNSFITKPVDIDKFIKVVRELNSYWLQLVALPPC